MIGMGYIEKTDDERKSEELEGSEGSDALIERRSSQARKAQYLEYAKLGFGFKGCNKRPGVGGEA